MKFTELLKVLISITIIFYVSCDVFISEEPTTESTIDTIDSEKLSIPDGFALLKGVLEVPVGMDISEIQNAKVFVVGQESESVVTDENGNFSLLIDTDVTGGLIARTVNHDHNQYQIITTSSSENSGKKVDDIIVTPDEETVLENPISVCLNGSISGKVILEGEADYTGIMVYIPGTSYLALTDATGNYSISNVPEGNYDFIRAEKDGFNYALQADITVISDQNTVVSDMMAYLSTGALGSILINGGDDYATNRTVTLSISASDNAALMVLSESDTFIGSEWKKLDTSVEYTFNEDGNNTIYIKFADVNGLESTPYFDSITIDSDPTVTPISPVGDISNISPLFDWSDSPLPSVKYRFQLSDDNGFTTIIEEATDITNSEYTLSNILDNNVSYFWRVAIVDENNTQWNWSTIASFDVLTVIDLSYEWNKSVGGISNDSGKSITTDINNNVYIFGYFNESVDFDPSSNGDIKADITNLNGDYFLTKYYSDGTYAWTQIVASNDPYAGSNTVITDSNSNVFIVGQNSSRNMIINKYNTLGELQWAKIVESDGFMIKGNAIDIDTSDNIYISGTYYGTVDFDPNIGLDYFTSNGASDVFLTKLSNEGEYEWTKVFGGSEYDSGVSIKIDDEESIIVAGHYRGGVNFNTDGGLNLLDANSQNIFISKFENSGNYLWTKVIEGTSGDDDLRALTIDYNNNIILTGAFYGQMDFDPGLDENLIAPIGGGDAFFLNLDSDGNLNWIKSFGGDSYNNGLSLISDLENNIYVIGTFSGTTDFDFSLAQDNKTSLGDWDIFILKINSDSTYGGSITYGSSNGEGDIGSSICIDTIGNIYTTGRFYEIVDFDTISGDDIFSSNGESDIFISKYSIID